MPEWLNGAVSKTVVSLMRDREFESLPFRQEIKNMLKAVIFDIKAAKAAGMKVILYSKNKIEGADAETSKFNELPGIIRKL